MKNQSEQRFADFRHACTAYLRKIGLADLRVYGRALGLPTPTKSLKPDLIADIINVHCGLLQVPAQRSSAGRPVNNHSFDPNIVKTINAFKVEYIENRLDTTPRAEERENTDTNRSSTETEEAPVSVVVRLSALTARQKSLFFQFLDSLAT